MRASQKEQRRSKRILGGEEDALSVPRRQKEKVSTLFSSLLQYEPSTVAVIHELVLPTEGNSFFPPGLQRL